VILKLRSVIKTPTAARFACGLTINGMVRPGPTRHTDSRVYRTEAQMRLVEGIATYGIDLGKSKFHVVGVGGNGHGLLRRTFRRASLLEFFANAPAALIGMEACPGSHWLARKLTSFGHTVRIIPAQFVKPFVKSNKNDAIDAAAIAEAVTRVRPCASSRSSDATSSTSRRCTECVTGSCPVALA